MSIDLSPRFAAGFPPVQPAATPSKTSSEAFDPFAVVRSGTVPESNRFVQALEHLYGIAEGSLTSPLAAESTAAPAALAASPAVAPSPANPEVSTLSELMRRATEQNVAGVTRQSAADSLLGPWAGQTDKPSPRLK